MCKRRPCERWVISCTRALHEGPARRRALHQEGALHEGFLCKGGGDARQAVRDGVGVQRGRRCTGVLHKGLPPGVLARALCTTGSFARGGRWVCGWGGGGGVQWAGVQRPKSYDACTRALHEAVQSPKWCDACTRALHEGFLPELCTAFCTRDPMWGRMGRIKWPGVQRAALHTHHPPSVQLLHDCFAPGITWGALHGGGECC